MRLPRVSCEQRAAILWSMRRRIEKFRDQRLYRHAETTASRQRRLAWMLTLNAHDREWIERGSTSARRRNPWRWPEMHKDMDQ